MVKSGLAILLLGAFYCSHGATLYVSQDGAHILPFNDWSAAATNIQAAIDAATAGDTVLVTNGTYSSGGRAVSGSVTNRVAIYKPIEVRSVNGAALTTIEGMWDGAMNGPSAVRCVWITNGAALRGFTLTKGATRSSNNSSGSDFSGGAVYGSTNGGLGLIDQCSVVSNAASYAGGGVFQANVSRCLIAQNQAVGFACAGMGPSGQGGGAYGSQLANCTIVSNVANFSGGGAELCSVKNSAILANLTGVQGGGICESVALNCTIVGNRAGDGYTNLTCHYPGYGGGENASSLTNCILFQNSAYGGPDYYLGNLAYCCATPLPGGPGNIAADPLLLADWLHLSSSSPCQGVGRPGAGSGTDIDGQLWAAIPSIGCDEWHEEPIAINRPRVVLTAGVRSLKIVADQFAGQEPFGLVWQKDGFPLSDDSHYYGANSRTLVITNLEPSDSGDYGLSASNAYGLAVTAFHTTLHFVSPAAPNPIPPFTNWTSAAMRIQDALESAFQDDVIVVTNGVYDTGGKVGSSDATTNRLVVGRGIGLMSVNGNSVTTIQGAWDVSSTNGNSAIRCVWLGDRSQMAGFTLSGGATVTSGKGGAVYCESFNSLVADCILTNNSALQGGGCYQGSCTAPP